MEIRRDMPPLILSYYSLVLQVVNYMFFFFGLKASVIDRMSKARNVRVVRLAGMMGICICYI